VKIALDDRVVIRTNHSRWTALKLVEPVKFIELAITWFIQIDLESVLVVTLINLCKNSVERANVKLGCKGKKRNRT